MSDAFSFNSKLLRNVICMFPSSQMQSFDLVTPTEHCLMQSEMTPIYSAQRLFLVCKIQARARIEQTIIKKHKVNEHTLYRKNENTLVIKARGVACAHYCDIHNNEERAVPLANQKIPAHSEILRPTLPLLIAYLEGSRCFAACAMYFIQ